MSYAQLPLGELSEHPTKGYRLSCGWYLKNGKKTPKVFWLGKDKNRAILEAAKIRWAAPIAAAMGGWTKDYEQAIRSTDTIALVQQHYQTAERLRILPAAGCCRDALEVSSPPEHRTSRASTRLLAASPQAVCSH